MQEQTHKENLQIKEKLNQVSRREYYIENESEIIRREVASIRERITNAIKSVANTITKTIGTTIQSVRERFKRLVNPKLAYIEENLDLLKNSRLYYRFVDEIDKKLTKEQQQRLIDGTFNPYNDRNFINWIKSTYPKNDIEEIVKFEKEKLNEQENISYKPRFKP